MQPNQDDMLVHYGCGLTAPAGWRNFDASPTVRAMRTPGSGLLVARVAAPFPANVEYGDNPDPALAAVEDESRWIDCLGIQCRKP